MPVKKREKNLRDRIVLTLVVILCGFSMLFVARYTGYTPTGPEVVSIVSNTTGSTLPSQQVNLSGGYIYTILLNVSSRNPRWKAFVGNVSGSVSLDNSNNYTIFDWPISFTGGEIYATRTQGTVNWTTINCTWGVTGNNTNRSVEERENYLINHSSPDDNISATFTTRNHSSFFVGSIQIRSNYCYSLYTYVNDTPQSSRFQEILLYDGTNTTNGNLVYVSILESDQRGYDNRYYDFQMLVPDRGNSGFSQSTAYNIYVELE